MLGTDEFVARIEREALGGGVFQDRQRDILVHKIDQRQRQDARKTPTASSLSLLGLLSTVRCWERRWFQVIVAGRPSGGNGPG